MTARCVVAVLVLAAGCGSSPPAGSDERAAQVPAPPVPPKRVETATTTVKPKPAATRRPRKRGRYRFVGAPIFLVGGSRKNGYTGVLFARVNRPLGLDATPRPRAIFLMDGRADLGVAFRGRAWRACYSQTFYDTLPKPPPEPGSTVTVALDVRRTVRDRAEVRVRAGTGGEDLDRAAQNRWFRRLGCAKARGANAG